uniref:DUF2905 domain-containing protein n=1 Tax=Thermoanaerobaculum aquaticum TaxID=1312852 RepID=A0A7V1ZHH9_9BACT
MGTVGRLLLVTGALLMVLGALLLIWDKTGWRLPGDIVIRGRNWTFYFPLATSLLLSALLTLVLWLVSRR